jgi:ferredoxin
MMNAYKSNRSLRNHFGSNLLWCVIFCGLRPFDVAAFVFSPRHNSDREICCRNVAAFAANSKMWVDGEERRPAQGEKEETHYLTVEYEGQSTQIDVRPRETVLAALERQGDAVRAELTALSELPSDCRRGNCLTCAAAVVGDGPMTKRALSVVRGEDGLSPAVSRQVADAGYVLTCSSTVRAPGLRLQLGENHRLWDQIYRKRLVEDEETAATARRYMAKMIRRAAERDVRQWARETEQVLQKSPED